VKLDEVIRGSELRGFVELHTTVDDAVVTRWEPRRRTAASGPEDPFRCGG
jgi:hypothetical protein